MRLDAFDARFGDLDGVEPPDRCPGDPLIGLDADMCRGDNTLTQLDAFDERFGDLDGVEPPDRCPGDPLT